MIKGLKFQGWDNNWREIPFVASNDGEDQGGFRSTVITGQNGSYKSTMLKELVAALIAPDSTKASVEVLRNTQLKHVICASGSVADRFPSKEKSGGGSTDFATEQYSYLGQRVGANLLSKKRPFETLLLYALDRKKAERFNWPFYKKAHEFASIIPDLEILVSVRKEGSRNQSARRSDDQEGRSTKELHKLLELSNFRILGNIPDRMAQTILDSFDEDILNSFRDFVISRKSRIVLRMASDGISCMSTSNEIVRLGFMLDIFSLRDVKVRGVESEAPFSIFDLSSGEYHMYTNLMGLGFGVQEESLMLLDEPDNSLHPQWQRDFMDAVHGICQMGMKTGHLIICTHSPLIVSSALEGSTIVDLSHDEPGVSVAKFGASSDDILLEQFGVASSRNRIVVDVVQKAVSLIEREGFEHPDLLAMSVELASIKSSLRKEDPLIDVIEAILGEVGHD